MLFQPSPLFRRRRPLHCPTGGRPRASPGDGEKQTHTSISLIKRITFLRPPATPTSPTASRCAPSSCPPAPPPSAARGAGAPPRGVPSRSSQPTPPTKGRGSDSKSWTTWKALSQKNTTKLSSKLFSSLGAFAFEGEVDSLGRPVYRRIRRRTGEGEDEEERFLYFHEGRWRIGATTDGEDDDFR